MQARIMSRENFYAAAIDHRADVTALEMWTATPHLFNHGRAGRLCCDDDSGHAMDQIGAA
jgi:hypothetical protein